MDINTWSPSQELSTTRSSTNVMGSMQRNYLIPSWRSRGARRVLRRRLGLSSLKWRENDGLDPIGNRTFLQLVSSNKNEPER